MYTLSSYYIKRAAAVICLTFGVCLKYVYVIGRFTHPFSSHTHTRALTSVYKLGSEIHMYNTYIYIYSHKRYKVRTPLLRRLVCFPPGDAACVTYCSRYARVCVSAIMYVYIPASPPAVKSIIVLLSNGRTCLAAVSSSSLSSVSSRLISLKLVWLGKIDRKKACNHRVRGNL